MGFKSIKQYVQALYANGQGFETLFQKTVGAFPYVAGSWYDLTLLAGSPRSQVYPGNLLEASWLTYRSAGNLWHGGPVSPATMHVKAAHVETVSATVCPSVLMLCDFVMFYPMFDFDNPSDQFTDNTPRSLPRYTNGKGLCAFIVSTSDIGAGIADLYVEYTNENGAHGRNLSVNVQTAASAQAGRIVHSGIAAKNYGPFLPLQAGDRGILTIDRVTLSQGTGGGWCTVVIVKPLLTIPLMTVGVPSERDYFADIPSLPRVQDGAYLGWLLFAGAAVPANSVLRGRVEFAWS